MKNNARMQTHELRNVFLLFLGVFFFCAACQPHYIPKPIGYPRMDFPEKDYQTFSSGCPFTFEYPQYAKINRDSTGTNPPCWINVEFPTYKAQLHISYFPITPYTPLQELVADAHKFAQSHAAKSGGMVYQSFAYPLNRVEGEWFELPGEVASSYQFFATNRSQHYLRAALYLQESAPRDSVQPALDFIEEDLWMLLSTLQWQ
jgi:gliding motility-associated lipoprotein GldD